MALTLRSILPLAFLGLVLAGCASLAPSGPAPGSAPGPAGTGTAAPTAAAVRSPGLSAGAPHRELIVFAAASLTDSFNEIAAAFSAKAGGATVTYNYGGSNTLRAQIEQGAPAGVFASANQQEMNTLVKEGLVTGTPAVFARNRLVVITPKSNPGKIEKLQDLARDGLKIVAAGPNVPVGGYMLQMLDKMNADPAYGAGFKDRVMRNVISQETDVKQVVAKIQLGEGDAGVVYSTDVTSKVAPDVRILDVPDSFNVIAQYPIAAIKGAKEEDLAKDYVSYVLSAAGQGILKKYNFVPPQ